MNATPEAAPAAATETTPRRIPAWVTDPALAASIEAGLIDIDDDLMGGDCNA